MSVNNCGRSGNAWGWTNFHAHRDKYLASDRVALTKPWNDREENEGRFVMIRNPVNNPLIDQLPRGKSIHLLESLLIAAIVVSGPLVRWSESSPQNQDEQANKSKNNSATPSVENNKSGNKPAQKADKAAKGKNTEARKKRPSENMAPVHEPSSTPLPKRPPRSVTSPTLTSAELDHLLIQYLTKTSPKVEPATLTTDVEFVRRIYFDVAGRPPTPVQVQTFLGDHSRDKRSRLIESLLASPEFARNWAKYWRDVVMFHSTSENPAQVRFDMLEDWLAKQLRANKPWDEIVTGMITATGQNDENGAVAFPLAYQAQPVEMAGEVSRIFMGVQIQCAQCHDHKTDTWKRTQFHEFAAFFAGMRPKNVVKASPGQPPVFAVVTQGSRRYTMPDKDNPQKQIPIAPRFFLASSTSKSEPALPETLAIPERRSLAASYVTGQDNPWFARAFINRTWYALMGEAFYEPIDDIGPERTPKAVEVLDPLAEQWQKGGYDIRWLFSTILNTQAYQRRIRSTANEAGKTPFASSCPSRLRADQVYDGLVQALSLPTDENRQDGQAKNGQPAASLSLDDPKRKQQGKPQGKAGAKKAAEAAGLASQIPKKAVAAVRRPGGQRLLFDRLFGIDPSIPNDDVLGTIPQALFLMNSPLINSRIQARPGTVLGEILTMAPNERAALGAIYLRVLSRQPTTHEVEVCGRYIASVGDRREAFEDIYWSLINTTEFLTRR
jgi:Protein of unknown function (DUF1549)/Protein of unknown function (DUF1553)